MKASAAGLWCCAAALALVLAPSGADGQQKAPARGGANPPPAAAKAAAGPSYAERFAGLCAACHGANGRSDMALTPVLAGQPSLYAITQLFLFREGRRNNEAMTAVAKTLKDDDLRGFKSGTRPGYTMAMTEAVSQIPVEDLDILAYYAARFTAPAGK